MVFKERLRAKKSEAPTTIVSCRGFLINQVNRDNI